MALELNIKPEDVEQLVKDSIMKAGFGKAVTEGITKAFSGFNNPVDDCIKRYVSEVTGQLLREKFQAEIHTAVAKALTERVTNEFIESVVAAATDKLVRAANERY